jgi:prepilin-type N-terminal cleavage/methylation domain-containing protein
MAKRTISPVGRSRSSGFTLVEILVVVVILGILAAIVTPLVAGAVEGSNQTAFIADMRTLANAVTLYTAETGEYLEDSSSGQLPTGLGPYIRPGSWTSGTPLGGVWDMELNSFGIISGFGVHFIGGGNPGDTYMQEVDRIFDDGNLATGGFQKIAADRYYYILAQ